MDRGSRLLGTPSHIRKKKMIQDPALPPIKVLPLPPLLFHIGLIFSWINFVLLVELIHMFWMVIKMFTLLQFINLIAVVRLLLGSRLMHPNWMNSSSVVSQ